MKKITAILVCLLVCFLLFTDCTNQKNGGNQDANAENSDLISSITRRI